MSIELADALRRFADQVERGDVAPNATEACIVVAAADGSCRSTYIGRKVPSRDAGTFLLAMGIQRFVVGMDPPQAAPTPSGGFGLTRGSTH
jgi:hypothetical protein